MIYSLHPIPNIRKTEYVKIKYTDICIRYRIFTHIDQYVIVYIICIEKIGNAVLCWQSCSSNLSSRQIPSSGNLEEVVCVSSFAWCMQPRIPSSFSPITLTFPTT